MHKGEIRAGYVKFMGNNKNGKAKFECVGTNKTEILRPTTFRVAKRFGRPLMVKIFQ